MAYKGIDRTRLKYLVTTGIKVSELRQFYIDCRIPLVSKGVKVQNPPKNPGEALSIFADLPNTADKVITNWFAKHITINDIIAVEDVIREFQNYEEIDDNLPKDYAFRLARSCLVHLFSDDSPHILLDFLQTPIPDQINKQKDVTETPVNPSKKWTYPEALPQVIFDIMNGREVSEYLVDFPPELASFIVGLQSAKQGNMTVARKVADEFSSDSFLRKHLEEFIKQQEESQYSKVRCPVNNRHSHLKRPLTEC